MKDDVVAKERLVKKHHVGFLAPVRAFRCMLLRWLSQACPDAMDLMLQHPARYPTDKFQQIMVTATWDFMGCCFAGCPSRDLTVIRACHADERNGICATVSLVKVPEGNRPFLRRGN